MRGEFGERGAMNCYMQMIYTEGGRAYKYAYLITLDFVSPCICIHWLNCESLQHINVFSFTLHLLSLMHLYLATAQYNQSQSVLHTRQLIWIMVGVKYLTQGLQLLWLLKMKRACWISFLTLSVPAGFGFEFTSLCSIAGREVAEFHLIQRRYHLI